MRARESYETTLPASKTQTDLGDGGVLALIWVFPMPATVVTRADRTRILLGRGEHCDVVMPGAETSREHGELVQLGRFWVVRDLRSTNQVHVNGQPVEEAPLSAGDVLRLGEWLGVVRMIPSDMPDERAVFHQLAPGLYGGALLETVLAPAESLAKSNVRIVIQGETGTGKERVAQAIHHWSGRRGKFVAFNCAAVQESLAEAHLFGHERGAFTGAVNSSPGYLRAAHGGTLLLDEVTDLPLPVQPKLLRALQENEVVPVGSTTPIPIDVRVITATQEPLLRAVEENRFRADLFARLDGGRVVLPPLRDRTEDAPGLFDCMIQRYLGCAPRAIEPTLLEQLCLHDWPFNAREVDRLAHLLAAIHGQEPVLKRRHLARWMRPEGEKPSPFPAARAAERPGLHAGGRQAGNQQAQAIDEAEFRREQELERFMQALRLHQGNVSRAAREIGISRQKGYRLMEYGPKADLDDLRRPSGPHAPDNGGMSPVQYGPEGEPGDRDTPAGPGHADDGGRKRK
jgi:DNA-binding NtrC family response regulator